MASAVVLVVLVFVLHFELTDFFKRLLRVATLSWYYVCAAFGLSRVL